MTYVSMSFLGGGVLPNNGVTLYSTAIHAGLTGQEVSLSK
jgi:hypothetical protein